MEQAEIKLILETAAKKLKGIQIPEVLHFSGTKNTLVELKNKFHKDWTNVIYIFSTEKLPVICSTVEKSQTKFEEINNRSRCMPRINEEHWKDLDSKPHCLYVGSCKAKPNERMRGHLCSLANTTYALHLKEWWTGDEEFAIDVFVFGESLPDNGYLQLVENILWEELKPLFGKNGGK
jgi:hypothetical protein